MYCVLLTDAPRVAQDCSFCREESPSCHALSWCPSTPGLSIFAQPPDWESIFPDESEDNLGPGFGVALDELVQAGLGAGGRG